MNPRILMIGAVVLIVVLCGSVAVYFKVFKDSAPPEDAAAKALTLDTDHDGYTDVAERAAGTDPNDPKRFPGSHKKVFTARTSINSNTLIKEDFLDVKEVAAKGEAPDAAVVEADKLKIVGHISSLEIKAGDYVMESMIYGGAPQLSYLVPRYKRAISLRYDPTAVVSELVELGDLVDVIGNFKLQRREGNALDYTKIIVQNARIVALGRMFLPKDPNDTSPNAVRTAFTVSVYPHEAERLIWAENYTGARLILALRAPVNDVLARTNGTTDELLFGKTLLNDPRAIEVYMGGDNAGGVARFGRADGERRVADPIPLKPARGF